MNNTDLILKHADPYLLAVYTIMTYAKERYLIDYETGCLLLDWLYPPKEILADLQQKSQMYAFTMPTVDYASKAISYTFALKEEYVYLHHIAFLNTYLNTNITVYDN